MATGDTAQPVALLFQGNPSHNRQQRSNKWSVILAFLFGVDPPPPAAFPRSCTSSESGCRPGGQLESQRQRPGLREVELRLWVGTHTPAWGRDHCVCPLRHRPFSAGPSRSQPAQHPGLRAEMMFEEGASPEAPEDSPSTSGFSVKLSWALGLQETLKCRLCSWPPAPGEELGGTRCPVEGGCARKHLAPGSPDGLPPPGTAGRSSPDQRTSRDT